MIKAATGDQQRSNLNLSKERGVLLAQVLFYVNALIWLAFGVASLIRLGDSSQTGTLVAIAVLVFGNVAAMSLAGVLIGRRSRWAVGFAALVLVANIILTFTDQFGVLDFVTLIIDLVLLVLVLANRNVLGPSQSVDIPPP